MISIVTPWAGHTVDLLADYEQATLEAELIIIDNASSPETADALRTLPPERGCVLRNEQNTGFAAANNQGYAQASGDIIIFLNSDVAGDPAWLAMVADDVKDGALYGPSLNAQLIYGLRLPYLEGWCVAATRATWDKIHQQLLCDLHHEAPNDSYTDGPWNQIHYPGPYWEDNDLCLRALQQDISLIQTAWPIQHKGGRTAGAIVKHGATFEANRATFVSRVKSVWEGMEK